MHDNELTGRIIGIAIDVHRSLGPGLLENAYKECLFYKLQKSGIQCIKEKPMPLIFEGVKMDCGYRIELGNYKLGLLINFNVVLLKNGIKRLINDTP